MALACNPKLLIADEATTALDVTTQAQIMELLCDLQDELGMAMILISHDMAIAASYTDEIAVMYSGRVVEQAPTARLFDSIRMPYTRALLDAVPTIEGSTSSGLDVIENRPTGEVAEPLRLRLRAALLLRAGALSGRGAPARRGVGSSSFCLLFPP